MVGEVARRQLGAKLRCKLDSMDVTQSVVWKAVEKIGAFRGVTRGELRGWLARQVVSRIQDHADYFGAQKRDMKREVPLGSDRDSVPGAMPRARTATPSRAAVTRECAEHCRAALSRLSDMERLLIERAQQGMTGADIASELGLTSAGAARMRCVRAQNKLSRLLGSIEST